MRPSCEHEMVELGSSKRVGSVETADIITPQPDVVLFRRLDVDEAEDALEGYIRSPHGMGDRLVPLLVGHEGKRSLASLPAPSGVPARVDLRPSPRG